MYSSLLVAGFAMYICLAWANNVLKIGPDFIPISIKSLPDTGNGNLSMLLDTSIYLAFIGATFFFRNCLETFSEKT